MLSKKRKRSNDEPQPARLGGVLTLPPCNALSILDQDDDADDSSVDEDYTQIQEPLPHLAAYDERVPELRTKVAEIVKALHQILEKYSNHHTHIAEMYRKASDLSSYRPPSGPKIMLYGNSGTGKSSTTNSFVDEIGLVKAVSGGESCTCVPTELLSSLPGQDQPFAATVKFFDPITCREFLGEQLDGYIWYHFKSDDSWTPEERQEFKARADTALKIMRSLFCDKAECNGPTAIKQLIKAHHENETVNDILDTFQQWYEQLLCKTQRKNDEYCYFSQAHSAEELNDLIQPHIYEQRDDGTPALWSTVECVRIGVPGSRILQHVCILDLPGTSDTNRVRATIANKHIKECDALWAITSIARPISDPLLDFIVAQYGETFHQNIAIIATCSDDGLNDALAMDLKRKGQSIGTYLDDKEELRALDKRIRQIKTKLDTFKPKGKGSEMYSNYFSLSEKHSELSDQRCKLRNSQLSTLIDARNTYVERVLQKEKAIYLPKDQHLAVFCISNTHYQAHRGVPSGDVSEMDVNLTGIPALRSHALKMAAPQELQNLDIYVQKAAVLVRGLKLWVESEGAQGHESLLRIVNEPVQLLSIQMESLSKSWRKRINQILVDPLKSGNDEFVHAATIAWTKIKAEWHHSTIRAFIRKDGKHQTKSRQFQSWNEHFIKHQTEKVLDKALPDLMKQQQTDIEDGFQKLCTQLSELPDRFEREPYSVPISLADFRDVIAIRISLVNHAYEENWARLKKKLRIIKLNATRDIVSSYFTITMVPTYAMCGSFSGSGCTSLMMETLYKKLKSQENASPFVVARNALKADLERDFEHVMYRFESETREILDEMSQVIKAILQRDSGDPQVISARAALKQFTATTLPTMERAQEDLIAIRAKYA